MASKKKEELLQPEVQTQAQPAAQSAYSMLSNIHKEFLKLNKNKRNNSIKNRPKTLTDSSPKMRYRWQISM